MLFRSIGENQRDTTLGHSPETFARSYGSGGLASEESVLLDIHVNISVQQQLKKEIHLEIDRRFALAQGIRALQRMSESHAS